MIDFQKSEKELIFIPLGGTNEIGMNLNLYQYKGKWIMVDCGAGFADDKTPGAEIIIPDITFIKKYKKDLLGIIITHAHEDHIGAIPYLIDELECPIYATNFTASFLEAKLGEFNLDQKPKIERMKSGSKITLGAFEIDLVPLSHSAPEMQALYIKTDKGNILHTGDWKFDTDPVLGQKSDEEQLKKLGDEGVLALVCDSTNVFTPQNAGSEGDLKNSLEKIISECKGLVLVTTFASNLARLFSIINVAEKLGRKVLLSGKSIHRVVGAARESGYLKNINTLIDETDIGRYRRNEILIIATGCQGEPMAAVNKIVNKTHRNINLTQDDTIIFSSKIIPGNDKRIFALFNKIIKRKIELITERDHFVHVSGHPGIADIKKIFEYTKAQICIPVHGEPVHIREHAKLAKKCNIPQTIEVENGSVVRLSSTDSKIIGTVKSGYFALDGEFIVPIDSKIFTMRKKMNYSGIVVITIGIASNNKSNYKILIDFPGLAEEKDEEFTNLLQDNIEDIIFSTSKSKIDEAKIAETIRSMVKKQIKREYNKYPFIMVNLVTI